MSKALEPIDISIHFAIAFAFVILVGLVGWFVLGILWLQYIAAPVAVVIFLTREGHQQMKKNVPPKHWWAIWQWGKNGLVEGLCTIPAVIAGCFALRGLQWLLG